MAVSTNFMNAIKKRLVNGPPKKTDYQPISYSNTTPLTYQQQAELQLKVIDEQKIAIKDNKNSKDFQKGKKKPQLPKDRKLGDGDQKQIGKDDETKKTQGNFKDKKKELGSSPKGKEGPDIPGEQPQDKEGILPKQKEVKGNQDSSLAPVHVSSKNDPDDPNIVKIGGKTKVELKPKLDMKNQSAENTRTVREERSKKEFQNAVMHHATQSDNARGHAFGHVRKGLFSLASKHKGMATLHKAASNALFRRNKLHSKASSTAANMAVKKHVKEDDVTNFTPKLDTKATGYLYRSNPGFKNSNKRYVYGKDGESGNCISPKFDLGSAAGFFRTVKGFKPNRPIKAMSEGRRLLDELSNRLKKDYKGKAKEDVKKKSTTSINSMKRAHDFLGRGDYRTAALYHHDSRKNLTKAMQRQTISGNVKEEILNEKPKSNMDLLNKAIHHHNKVKDTERLSKEYMEKRKGRKKIHGKVAKKDKAAAEFLTRRAAKHGKAIDIAGSMLAKRSETYPKGKSLHKSVLRNLSPYYNTNKEEISNFVRRTIFNEQENLNKKVLDINGYPFIVELALTPEQRAQGLMHRQSLELDHGMLFDMGREEITEMWMHETYLPLDMIFIDSQLVIRNIVSDCMTESDDMISSKEKIRYVLEINAGLCEECGIKIGDQVQIDELSRKTIRDYKKTAHNFVTNSYKEHGKVTDQAKKRIKGVGQAKMRLAPKSKVQEENLDELKKSTLISYYGKAADEREKLSGELKKINWKKRTANLIAKKDPNAIKKGDNKKILGKIRKFSNRNTGISRAHKRIGEDVKKNLNELSTKLLKGYVKGSEGRGKKGIEGRNRAYSAIDKRDRTEKSRVFKNSSRRALRNSSKKHHHPEKVKNILHHYSQGKSFRVLAHKFGSTVGGISGIVYRNRPKPDEKSKKTAGHLSYHPRAQRRGITLPQVKFRPLDTKLHGEQRLFEGRHVSVWNADKETQLLKHHEQGHSYNHLAKTFNTTRGSIAGIIDRLRRKGKEIHSPAKPKPNKPIKMGKPSAPRSYDSRIFEDDVKPKVKHIENNADYHTFHVTHPSLKKKTLKVSVHHNPKTKEGEVFVANKKTGSVNFMGKLGHSNVKHVIGRIKHHVPDVESLTGFRSTGSRKKARKTIKTLTDLQNQHASLNIKHIKPIHEYLMKNYPELYESAEKPIVKHVSSKQNEFLPDELTHEFHVTHSSLGNKVAKVVVSHNPQEKNGEVLIKDKNAKHAASFMGKLGHSNVRHVMGRIKHHVPDVEHLYGHRTTGARKDNKYHAHLNVKHIKPITEALKKLREKSVLSKPKSYVKPTPLGPFIGTTRPEAPQRTDSCRTGIPEVDAIINSKTTKAAINFPVVDRSHSVPYMAGGSVPLADPTVYMDSHVPRKMTAPSISNSKKMITFDPARPWTVHENVEQHVMEILIKAGMKPEEAYRVAHFEFAEKAEQAWYKYYGINAKAAEKIEMSWLPKIQREDTKNVPPNLYKKPYPHSCVGDAKHESIHETPPSKEEVKQAFDIIRKAIRNKELDK